MVSDCQCANGASMHIGDTPSEQAGELYITPKNGSSSMSNQY